MKAILQRVTSASVTVDKQLISTINTGILVFAAVAPGDTKKEVEQMASKVLRLKMWDGEDGGRWKQSVQDIRGEVLCVSQFTLLASTKKGNKPDFHGAMSGEQAKELYDQFVNKVRDLYLQDRVKNGVFQAAMSVAMVNDGPVGVDYRSDEGAVTLEINTNPKATADEPSSSQGAESEDCDFSRGLPPSLLE
ncbi:MAG: D-tyrosyl-tRNA(Tyr) deacylase [Candelina submexicana]|nr:MAG: D-tyrosyl-tRNA(Tyr) deacylase [Candelina submexicana]